MNSGLTQKEINEMVGAKSNVSANSVKRVWGNLVELIISELQNNGSIKIQNFGKFELTEKGGGDAWVENEYGVKELKYIDVHYDVDFIPSETLIKHISGEIMTKWTKRAIAEECNADSLLNRPKSKYKYIKSDLPICENMTEKILALVQVDLEKTKNKKQDLDNDTVAKNRELMKKRTPKKVKCLDNGVIYKSWNDCARQLNIRTAKLTCLFNRTKEKFVECDGYTFEKIDE